MLPSLREQHAKNFPSGEYALGVESRFEKSTDVIRSAIFWPDIASRGDIYIRASGVREGLGDTALWPAGNDQLDSSGGRPQPIAEAYVREPRNPFVLSKSA